MHDKSKYYYNFNCMVISGRIEKVGLWWGKEGHLKVLVIG